MCVTTEVQGRINLYEGLRKPDDATSDDSVARSLVEQGASQWLPNQRNRYSNSESHDVAWISSRGYSRRQVTYISRLQCVQAAVHRQLESLALNYPNHRVALVAFNHELSIFGDGTSNLRGLLLGDSLMKPFRFKRCRHYRGR